MKISITYRLFLSILIASVLAIVCMAVVVQWSIDRGFRQYVDGIDQSRMVRLAGYLERMYISYNNWNFLRDNRTLWHTLAAAAQPDEGFHPSGYTRPMNKTKKPEPPYGMPPPPDTLQHPHGFEHRVLLLDAERKFIVGPNGEQVVTVIRPLRRKEQVIGYLALLPRPQSADPHQLRFMKQQQSSLVLVAAAVVLVAIGIALPLARRLVRPIGQLAMATHSMAAGQFDVRVPVSSSDEMGRLAGDFNILAKSLQKNEEARRQWVADISHELRTPLSVLRGEIEALQDGVRQPTADSIRSLHGEVIRLSRLIEDLYQLSLSDLGALAYQKENLALASLVEDAAARYRQELGQKNILLSLEMLQHQNAIIFGDAERLRQLLDNLFENSLKYTDRGGSIMVQLTCRGTDGIIDFQDSSPGVPGVAIGRLFDRLYRVDTSRNRDAGGAGLGLAICKSIVEAHEGTITARPSPMGGLWISIALPLAEKCQ